jgi:hypothetical protein
MQGTAIKLELTRAERRLRKLELKLAAIAVLRLQIGQQIALLKKPARKARREKRTGRKAA